MIAEAIAGDREALGKLLMEKRGMVANWVRPFSPENVDDVVQEVFARVVKYIRTASANSFHGWLKRVAITVAINFNREWCRPRLLPMLVGFDKPEQEVEEVDHDHLHRCLSNLEPRDREIIDAHYFAGHTLKAIASQLGVPIGTAKTRLYRARQSLLRIVS